MANAVSIGCGSADAGDRLDWPVELADSGLCSYMAFDSLAERTMAFAHARKMADPNAGYNERLPKTVDAFSPFLRGGGRCVSNHGAGNPEAGSAIVVERLRANGMGGSGKKVGVVYGDDCLKAALDADLRLEELGTTISAMGDRVVGAYAYIGAEPVVDCLERGADF